MALNPKLSIASRNLALNAALDVLNTTGTIKGYDGAQPTDADTAIAAQVLLWTNTFGGAAWGAAAAASKAANALTAANAVATSTNTWYRMFTGATAVWDGTVGTATVNLVFNSVAISSGANVAVTGFTATMAA